MMRDSSSCPFMRLLILWVLCGSILPVQAGKSRSSSWVRTETLLTDGWLFSREDNVAASEVGYDDAGWQSVTVPHDWAIYGPFSIHNDKQNVAITQDGQKEAMEHAGRTGGLPFVGIGWYRLHFTLPQWGQDRRASLVFDGAMSHAVVYINGHKAGYQPYGYNSFAIDITPYVHEGDDNVLAVRLENQSESSRWYPGAGLYRNVHLVVTGKVSVATWGTRITTPVVHDDYAQICVQTELNLPDGTDPRNVTVETRLLSPDGDVVSESTGTLTRFDNGICSQQLVVEYPQLWDIEHPFLYKAVTVVRHRGQVTDNYLTRFGIRTIEVIPDQGFFLNGKRVVFKGTCNHHDLGPLGAAVNLSAIRRRIRLLKDMGCNAYRTSHNMPSPELVQACNEMGMLVMAESFDEWGNPKVANGYNKVFNEWVEHDIVQMVRHYRNDPSVVMWCIGNEVPDQGSVQGAKTALMIQSIFHREDPTRPCTQGMDRPDNVINNNFAAVMDVPGFNYRPFKYQEAYRKLPQRVLIGSETASTLSSRGVYKFPVQRRVMAKYPDHQASSYDVEHCSWSDLPEDNFIMYETLPYDMGEFVWTGFDYLGEPTPYYSDWPSHSSLFGIIDLAGLPKDRFYLYRSVWNPDMETLHILPHWTWHGREGEVTPVFVYSNYPTVELFVNGRSQGRRTKDEMIKLEDSYYNASAPDFARQRRYRLMWMDVRYEPGTLRAVAYNAEGQPCAEALVETAGEPYAVQLIPEPGSDTLTAGTPEGELAFFTVRIVDKQGRLCPHADNMVSFKVKGEGCYRAGANGDPTCIESFQNPQMHVFNGMMTAIVMPTGKPGTIRVEARSKGLRSASSAVHVVVGMQAEMPVRCN